MSSNKTRHSYVAFYPSDWLGGTARMTRLVRSVYFDICLYCWDKNEPVSPAELMLMTADLEGQGNAIVDALVKIGKLQRDAEGNVWSERAMSEAGKAFTLWEKKSQGGKKGSARTNGAPAPAWTPDETPAGETPQNQNQNQNQNQTPSENPDANASSSSGADEGEQPKADGEGKEEGAPQPAKTPRISREEVETVANAWNAMALKNGLAQVKKITDERAKKIRARIGDYGVEEIVKAINEIPSSNFLLGRVGGRPWKADMEFFLRPDTVTRILEGAFANSNSGGWANA